MPRLVSLREMVASIAFQPGKMHGIEGFDWSNYLGARSALLNDAHAACWERFGEGAAKGANDAILLTLGTGVGGAILSDGRLMKGSFGRAGHLGHVSVSEEYKAKHLRNARPLEAAIGNYTVSARSNGRFSSTRTDLVRAHCAGDAGATIIWEKSLRTLARAIASFINILDPEIVILAGGITKAGTALLSLSQLISTNLNGDLVLAVSESFRRSSASGRGHMAQLGTPGSSLPRNC